MSTVTAHPIGGAFSSLVLLLAKLLLSGLLLLLAKLLSGLLLLAKLLLLLAKLLLLLAKLLFLTKVVLSHHLHNMNREDSMADVPAYAVGIYNENANGIYERKSFFFLCF